MKNLYLRAVSAVFCFLLAATLHAQSDPSAPSGSTPGASLGSQSSSSASTVGQQTPGVTRQPSTRSNIALNSDPGGGGTGTESPTQAMEDKMFLKEAAQGGMLEIAAGQAASARASNEAVRKFGQKMITDHTQLNNDLKPFADRMGIEPPQQPKSSDQAELDKLNQLTGDAFDREYVAFMQKDHADDLKDFDRELSQTGDTELRMTVMRGRQAIERHKKMIDSIAASLGGAKK